MGRDLTANINECKRCAGYYYYGNLNTKNPPCLDAYALAQKLKRPQLRFEDDRRVGDPCPVACTWKELRQFAVNPKGPFDTDAYGRGLLPILRQKAAASNFDKGTNLDDDWVAEACDYTMKGKSGRRRYQADKSGDGRAAIRIYPDEYGWKQFLNRYYYKQVLMDPFAVWVGGAQKIGGGRGWGSAGGGDTLSGAIYNVGCAQYTEAGKTRGIDFTASLTRTKTYGAGGGGGFSLVIIAGLNSAKDLKGAKFKGTDVNLSIGLAVGGLAKAAKFPKLVKLAKAISKGGRIDAKKAEDALSWLKVGQGGLGVERGNGLSINVIDVPGGGGGLEVAYVEWEGEITSASAFM